MKKKLLIIFDILFRNGQYLKATKDLFVKDNLYIKESIVYPLELRGRVILTKNESENASDEAIFNKALLEILNNSELLNNVEKHKFEAQDYLHFLDDTKRIVYEVKLKFIPKKQ